MDGSNFLFFWFDSICAVSFLISAWINLVGKRITRFGPDALIFLFYSVFRKEKVLQYNLREHPAFIHRIGLISILLGFSFLNAAMENLKIIWPYIQR